MDAPFPVAEGEHVHPAIGIQLHPVGDEPGDQLAGGALLMLMLERAGDIHIENEFGLHIGCHASLVEREAQRA